MTLRLELPPRSDTLTCPACRGEHQRVYGNVYDNGLGIGVYSADLHQHAADRRALLALGVRTWNDVTHQWGPCSVTIEVWPTATEFRMAFRDASYSPFADSGLLGRVLDQDEARRRLLRDDLLQIADHSIQEDPRVRGHLDSDQRGRR